MKEVIGQIHVGGRELMLRARAYRNGRLVVAVVGSEGEPWGVLTVNLPDVPLQEGEILVKTWDENAPFREPALASGRFVDTGGRVPINHVSAEVWRVVP